MKYKRIKPKKIYEEVTETILTMIKEGQIKPGEKLVSVEQLAENFQVGRSAIREALSALQAMGLVEMRQGEGTFVRQFDASLISLSLRSAVLMDKQDIQHLLEVRKILEAGAVIAAAEKRTEADLQKMKNVLLSMKDPHSEQDEWGENADLAFHLAIAGASHNPLLINLMRNVSEWMIETMRETRRVWMHSDQTTADQLYEEHQQIYDAIKIKDGNRAQQYLLQHLHHVEQVLKDYLK